MGGAHVFPGGKLDDDDHHPSMLARLAGETSESIAARMNEDDATLAAGLVVAAIRETFEEAGVVLGDMQHDTDLETQRKALETGTTFAQFANAVGLTVQTSALVPYARWITPEVESHRFDARFLLAIQPENQLASHDGTETTSAIWLRPNQALDDAQAGKIQIAPPTLRTLEWLSSFHQPEDALRDAATRKPPVIRPKVIVEGSGWFLALPGDPAHPESDAVIPGPTRMVFIDQRWKGIDS